MLKHCRILFVEAEKLDLYGITISSDNVTKSQIEQAHLKNKRVTLWNIHNGKDMNVALKKNPDYIQTDSL